MILSRVTLARMLAAAMLRLNPSPPTKAVCSTGNPFTGNPSTKAWAGGCPLLFNPSNERFMARWVALRILSCPISSEVPSAIAKSTDASSVNRTYNPSLCSCVSFLESSRPSNSKSSGRMTAAATTGPAKGPLPASSTPATGWIPWARSSFSWKSEGPPDLVRRPFLKFFPRRLFVIGRVVKTCPDRFRRVPAPSPSR